MYYNTGIDKEFDRIFMNTIKQSGNSINTIILSGQIEALMQELKNKKLPEQYKRVVDSMKEYNWKDTTL